MIGVQSISMLEGAFERTRAYTKDRMVFGKPLIQLQVSIQNAEEGIYQNNVTKAYDFESPI